MSECDGNTSEGAARPEVRSAVLEGDLQGKDAQFPANQIVVSAANAGRTALLVNVSADPRQPDDVDAGEYQGGVVVERSDGSEVPLKIKAVLASRNGSVTAKALGALALGAFAGTLLKWIEGSFTALAALRRRQRRVEGYLQRYEGSLPVSVQQRLSEIRDAIRRYDAEGVAVTLDEIQKNQDALLAFSAGVSALERQLAEQERMLHPGPGSASVTDAMEVEKAFLEELRTRIWPWEQAEAESVNQAYKNARSAFSFLTSRLRVARSGDPKHTTELEALARWMAREGPDNLSKPFDEKNIEPITSELPSDVVRALDTTAEQGMIPPELGWTLPVHVERRPLGIWLLDHAWWLTLAVVASVVVFVGYQTEFLADAGFEGDRSDYVALAAWALAIQVAGGTIIETVGKLSASRSSPQM